MKIHAPYQLEVTSTARRQLAEVLPTAIAFAAYESITGPLLKNPHRVGKQLMPPLDAGTVPTAVPIGSYRIDGGREPGA